jgi:hypothetical protein
MTNTPHDNFAKGYLKELLSPLGTVETERGIIDEPRYIDVLFSPSTSTSVLPESIGLLARLAIQTAVIEVFRNQPDDYQMLMCANRLFSYVSELGRKAKSERVSVLTKDWGKLWIISTTASDRLLGDYGAELDPEINCQGVYSFHKGWRGFIIAINQLPVTDETLWLRVLGKGKVQRQAVEEFLALPDTNPYKDNTLRLLANLRIVTLKQTDLSEDEREDVMNLSTAYLEWEQKTIEQSEQRGELKGEQNMIIQLLNYRFSEIDSSLIKQVRTLTREKLTELGKAIFNLSTVTDLQQWLESKLKPVERE